MPSVTIDAGVLAVPSSAASREAAYHYLDTLLDWSTLLKERWVAIYMSESASGALLDDNMYPLRDDLRRFFAKHEIVEYDVNTVATVADRLLRLTPSFESHFAIQEVLTHDVEMIPDILETCSGISLRSDLARIIVLVAILRQHCYESVFDHSLILRRANGQTVHVRALICMLEHHREDLQQLPNPPDYLESDVLVCDNFKGLIECLDENIVLLQASDDVGVEAAIQISLFKSRLESGATPDWNDTPTYSLGRRFWPSFLRLNPTEQIAAASLRAIIETLERTNAADTHWLRLGEGGNDPQIVRTADRAKAWRRDIDRNHHLHYWLCPDGTIELASIAFPHDDYDIPE